MATFTPEQLSDIFNRGFPGTPYPLIPVPTEYVRGDIDYFTPVGEVQRLYKLGTCQALADGVYVIDKEIWRTTEIETEDYYNTFNGIDLSVVGNRVEIKYMHDDTQLSPPTQVTEFTDDVNLGATHVRKDGDVYLCLAYNPNRGVIDFALNFDYYINDSVIPNITIGENVIEFLSVQQWEDNQPWYYIMYGEPEWFDPDTQVPPIGEGGGGGGFYRPSDTNWFSGLPALDILAFDMISQYQLTPNEARSLGQFLWSTNFVDVILKAWQSPFENIINLAFVPLASEIAGSAANIKIGNVDTNISSKKLSKSLYAKDFGTINMKELYRNFADYAPFTKLSIYLPGCGIKTLNPDDYMDGSLSLMGYIDIFSGTIVYQTGSIRHGRQHIVDHYQGNIQTSIPVTGANYASAYQSAINGLAQMGSGIVSNAAHSFNVMGAANSAMNIKPDYGKASGTSGSAMRLSVQKPYIFFDTPQLRAADEFRYLHGYVSNQYEQLGNCKGFVSVKYIDISGINAPEEVKDRILDKLRRGVHIHEA